MCVCEDSAIHVNHFLYRDIYRNSKHLKCILLASRVFFSAKSEIHPAKLVENNHEIAGHVSSFFNVVTLFFYFVSPSVSLYNLFFFSSSFHNCGGEYSHIKMQTFPKLFVTINTICDESIILSQLRNGFLRMISNWLERLNACKVALHTLTHWRHRRK